MIEDLLRPVRKRTGRWIRCLPLGDTVLALKSRHSRARQLCDMLADMPDDALAFEAMRNFANLTPPHLLAEIYGEMARLSSGDRAERLPRVAPLWHPVQAKAQPLFTKLELTTHADLFLSARPTTAALICFPDYWDQIFMPCSQALMKIGAADLPPVHIVVLRSRRLGSFASGVPGLGESLSKAVCALRKQLASHGITHRAYLGASVGGFFALRAALCDPGTTGISLAGRFFRMSGLVRLRDLRSGYDPLLCGTVKASGALHAIYGAEEAIDATHAERLQFARPEVRLHPIEGNRLHDPLAQFAAQRKLQVLFQQIVEQAHPNPPDFVLP